MRGEESDMVGITDCEASVRTGFAMTGYKKRGANPGGAM